jgi:hypothetical protein
MKIKSLLFLFAVGLGSATVYAETPRDQCFINCAKAFDRCNGPNSDGPDPLCIEYRTYCEDACDLL